MKSEYKLHKSDVENVSKTGFIRSEKSLSGTFLKNKCTHPRAAFVVSKKVAPHAVTRNKMKRRSRAAFNSVVEKDFSYDAVFFLRKEVETLPFPLLVETFKKILS